MNYRRVIPRDLFNEAKLLKCLGKLVIEADYTDHVKIHHDSEYDLGFSIQQDPSNGSISVANISVTVNGTTVMVYTGLNARDDWPMYADFDDKTVAVLDGNGKLTDEFLAIGEESE